MARASAGAVALVGVAALAGTDRAVLANIIQSANRFILDPFYDGRTGVGAGVRLAGEAGAHQWPI